MTDIIPAKTRLAAKRAFVRTSVQTASGAIPAGGVSVVALQDTEQIMKYWRRR